MMFVNWYPDPRFKHLPGDGTNCSLAAVDGGRSFTATTTDGFAYFQLPTFDVPAGEPLNLVVSLSAVGTPNLSWGYIVNLYDAAGSASSSSSQLATLGSTGEHLTKRFTAPASGRARFQIVCPSGAGNSLTISEMSIVSDAGLAWMRDNDQWWIHHALMPLTR